MATVARMGDVVHGGEIGAGGVVWQRPAGEEDDGLSDQNGSLGGPGDWPPVLVVPVLRRLVAGVVGDVAIVILDGVLIEGKG